MTTKKSASDDYINYRRKFTDKEKIRLINLLCKEWVLTTQEVCDRLICEGLAREKKKLFA